MLLLSPFAPHMAEELWQLLGHAKSLAYEPWPAFDPAAVHEDTVEVPVQINGKLRGRITVPAGASTAAIEAAARSDARIAELLAGQDDRESDRRARPVGQFCRRSRCGSYASVRRRDVVIHEDIGMRNVMTLVLGGGRGTRLYPLTKYRSKPAVPLAGKYRLIDIPLSNCINSGLNQIYVLTQFNSVSLHRHIRRTYASTSSAAASSKSWPPSKRSTPPTGIRARPTPCARTCATSSSPDSTTC